MRRRVADASRERITAKTARPARAGKVLADWGQNDRRRSTVAPYSLRAMRVPTVSTPLVWDEIDRLVAERREIVFTPSEVVARVDRLADLFRPVLEVEQRLPR